jgi:hypothetical protein
MLAVCFFVTANEAITSAGIHRIGKITEPRFNPMIRADDGSLSRQAIIAGVRARAALSIKMTNPRPALRPDPSVWIIPILVVWASSSIVPATIGVNMNNAILVVPAK